MPAPAKPGPAACLQAVLEASTTGASIAGDEGLRLAFANVRSAAENLLNVEGIASILVSRHVPGREGERVIGRMANFQGAIGRLRRYSATAFDQGADCYASFERALEHSNHLHPALTGIIPTTETAARHF